MSGGPPIYIMTENCVLLLGYFDGVHLGHQVLIRRAADIARERGSADTEVGVWTFRSLPIKKGGVLTDNDEKCALLKSHGVNFVTFADFNELRAMDGEDFFNREIADRYSPMAVVCGYNYRFGRNAASDASDLSEFAAKRGILCEIVPDFTLDGQTVSSTAIRAQISAGEMEKAAALLGRNYSITSTVLHGHEIGRTIGHPTINQRIPENRAVPPHGVYACSAEFPDRISGKSVLRGGVCNIGSRPTVNSDESDVTLETYIFDYSGDLYGADVKIEFLSRIRGERKFDDVDALKRQIDRDSAAALEICKSCGI